MFLSERVNKIQFNIIKFLIKDKNPIHYLCWSRHLSCIYTYISQHFHQETLKFTSHISIFITNTSMRTRLIWTRREVYIYNI